MRQLEIWQNPEVHEVLAGTLGFLSDDSYEFDFRRAETPVQQKELYFPHLIDASAEHDEVALFSGGIDSFAGVVNDVVTLGKSITLVGHYSSSKVRNVQESLIDGLSQKGFDRRISYIPVWVSNQGVSAREFTQRTRSFLFACLGLVVARMSGKDRFSFYENGVISINPPLAGDVIGGRATRTTHPKVLRGLEALFSILLDHQIEIQTPLHWLTKKEVTQKIKEADMSDMLGQTVSCTRPRIWTERQKHCGVCSQCIDRRFAVLAAGMEDHEPSSNYMRDLLLGDRSADDDLRMALSYVSFFQKVAATPKERFLVDFPEVVSALDQFPGLSPDDAENEFTTSFSAMRRRSRTSSQQRFPSTAPACTGTNCRLARCWQHALAAGMSRLRRPPTMTHRPRRSSIASAARFLTSPSTKRPSAYCFMAAIIWMAPISAWSQR